MSEQNWEKRFDEQFVPIIENGLWEIKKHWDFEVVCDHDDGYACEHRLEGVKAFIRQELERQQKASDKKQRTENIKEKMKWEGIKKEANYQRGYDDGLAEGEKRAMEKMVDLGDDWIDAGSDTMGRVSDQYFESNHKARLHLFALPIEEKEKEVQP